MSFGPCCVADVFAYYEDNGITKSALLSMTSVVNEPDEDLSARITATFWQECSSKILHLTHNEDDLAAVQDLMTKLRTIKQSAKLRFKTTLRPVIRQDTRWGSTF
ncbi:hypothetical protein PPTG_18483 [Phytophthora nicotianae INRA-310]|uniref:Uncharacterized protein n=1 Tax=Phytophthora nicotianae (strain INRA-310) TaxID=761204 RepID=W2PI64_PHYN3|nr:hypothetical protein PPTG_18483 [Phytophthora nicotianae INRA-310]ETM99719.1 hypothetical protein PPTG_18483 [Phytophthora nicotianae INRA-310]